MDNIGQVTLTTLSLFGHQIEINPLTFYFTWVVMGVLVMISLFASRGLKTVPSSLQNFTEIIYEFIEDIVVSSLGKKEGRKFIPFILTIFLFTLFSNWIGILPNLGVILGTVIALVHKLLGGDISIAFNSIFSISLDPNMTTWYSFLLKTPNFTEPTRSVNTDLAMAIMVFVVVHVNSVRRLGIIDYLKQYWGDVIPCRGWWLLLAPVNPMIPLNIIGEISSVISHSFRLFGNIFGGFMIVTIVGTLTKFFLVPVGLLAFFGLFAGLVQAFVFTMLAITYISQKA